MKKFIALTASSFAFLFNPLLAFAQSVTSCPYMFSSLCISSSQTGELIKNAFNIAVIVAVLIATGYLIYGGIKWVTSAGDKTNVESARNHIVAAIIGLIVVFLAFFIINIILGVFGINTNTFTIPTLTQ